MTRETNREKTNNFKQITQLCENLYESLRPVESSLESTVLNSESQYRFFKKAKKLSKVWQSIFFLVVLSMIVRWELDIIFVVSIFVAGIFWRIPHMCDDMLSRLVESKKENDAAVKKNIESLLKCVRDLSVDSIQLLSKSLQEIGNNQSEEELYKSVAKLRGILRDNLDGSYETSDKDLVVLKKALSSLIDKIKPRLAVSLSGADKLLVDNKSLPPKKIFQKSVKPSPKLQEETSVQAKDVNKEEQKSTVKKKKPKQKKELEFESKKVLTTPNDLTLTIEQLPEQPVIAIHEIPSDINSSLHNAEGMGKKDRENASDPARSSLPLQKKQRSYSDSVLLFGKRKSVLAEGQKKAEGQSSLMPPIDVLEAKELASPTAAAEIKAHTEMDALSKHKEQELSQSFIAQQAIYRSLAQHPDVLKNNQGGKPSSHSTWHYLSFNGRQIAYPDLTSSTVKASIKKGSVTFKPEELVMLTQKMANDR